ncbi:MAG: type II toxin-antitoxin system VapC family toxin [Candidatus Korobacteraceae bacterium]
MIVLDASAAIEWLLQTPTGVKIGRRIFGSNETLHAPHLLDVEVTQVLRRYVSMHSVAPSRAGEALQDLLDLRLHRHPHAPFVQRAWELRGNLTAYDALYVALSEALGATLVTCDARLAAAPGHRARVQLV